MPGVAPWGRGGVHSRRQVCISYGQRSNDQLLLYYGFVEAENADDQYEVRGLTWAAES